MSSKVFAYPPFDNEVITQINARQLILGNNSSLNSNPEIQQWKFNNSSWIRLASSINIDVQVDASGSLVGSGKEVLQKILSTSNTSTILDYAGDKLAKSFVLYGGVSNVVENTVNQKPIITSDLRAFNEDYFINSGPETNIINNFTYGFGGLTQGIRPMPGIKSVNVTYVNRGTNAKAEIELIAFTREQLAIIETLYLHPGYNLLLEWGHSLYYSNKTFNDGGISISSQDFNDTAAFTKLFSGKQFNVGSMARTIYGDSLARSGNYEGMFGPVSNFNYKFNPDGTYSITVYMQSVGLLAESLKLNSSASNAKFNPGASALLRDLQARLEKEQQDLDVLVAKTKVEAQQTQNYYNSDQYKRTRSFQGESTLQNNIKTKQIIQVKGADGKIENRAVYKETNTVDASAADAIKNAQATLAKTDEELKKELARIAELDPNDLTESLRFSNILNYWLSAQRKTMDNYVTDHPPGGENGKLYDVLYEAAGLYQKGYADSDKNQRQVIKDDAIVPELDSSSETYIRLGTLLDFISDNLLIYNDNNTAIFTIDTTKANNICTRHYYSISGDPTICVIDNPNIELGTYSNGSKAAVEDKLSPYSFIKDKDNFLGYTMNIFVNLNFAAVASVQYMDSDGNVSLFDYIKHIMNGIKTALGYVNDWEVSYDSLTNKITIKELAYVKSGDPRAGALPARFNIYGFDPFGNSGEQIGSFVESVDFNVTLDSKFQANAVVNATSQGGDVLGEDTTALATFNKGLTDRTFKSKFSQRLLGISAEEKIPSKFNKEELDKLVELAVAFYGPSPKFSLDSIGVFTNVVTTVGKYLISYQVKQGMRAPKNVIPFDLGLTMMGLGGIRLYERYTTDDKVLPPNFSRLDFIVKAVSHTITENKWTTKVQSLAVASSGGVTGIDKTKYEKIVPPVVGISSGGVWTGNEPQFKKRSTVNSIVLHTTDGNPNNTAQQAVNWVGGASLAATLRAKGKDWWNQSGIHYGVGSDGSRASGIPDLRISVHGDDWNTYSVGIETVGAFVAVQAGPNGDPNGTGTWWSASYKNDKGFYTIKLKPEDVVDLGFYYEGYRYYYEFTDKAIESLEATIRDIIAKFPNIKKGITGSAWKNVWGIDGKPGPKARVSATKYTQGIMAAKDSSAYGIFAHATGGGTHRDIQPTPKILAMLKRLGYDIDK